MSEKKFTQFVLDSLGHHKGKNLSDYLSDLDVEKLDLFTGAQKGKANFFFVPSGYYLYKSQTQKSQTDYENNKRNVEQISYSGTENNISSSNFEGAASVMQILYNIDEFIRVYNNLSEDFEPIKNIAFDRPNNVYIKNPPQTMAHVGIRNRARNQAKQRVRIQTQPRANEWGLGEMDFAINFDKICQTNAEIKEMLDYETQRLIDASNTSTIGIFSDDHKGSIEQKLKYVYGIHDLVSYNKLVEFQTNFSRIAKEFTQRTVLEFLGNEYTLEELIEKKNINLANLDNVDKSRLKNYAIKLAYKMHDHLHGDLIDTFYKQKIETENRKDLLSFLREKAHHEIQALSKDVRKLIIDDIYNTQMQVADSLPDDQLWPEAQKGIQKYITENETIVCKLLTKKSKYFLEKYDGIKRLVEGGEEYFVFDIVKRNLNYIINNLVEKDGKLKTNFQAYSNYDLTLLTQLFDTDPKNCKNPILMNRLFENYITTLNEQTVGTYQRIHPQYRNLKIKGGEKLYEKLSNSPDLVDIEALAQKSLMEFLTISKDHFEYRDLLDSKDIIPHGKRFEFDKLLAQIKTTIDYAGAIIFNQQFDLDLQKKFFGEMEEDKIKQWSMFTLQNLLTFTKTTIGLNPYNLHHSPTRKQKVPENAKAFVQELGRRDRTNQTLNKILEPLIGESFYEVLTQASLSGDLNAMTNNYFTNGGKSLEESLFISAKQEFKNTFLDNILFLSSFKEGIRVLEDGEELYFDIFDGNFQNLKSQNGFYVNPINQRKEEIKISINGEIKSELKVEDNNDIFESAFLYSTNKKNNYMIIQSGELAKDFVKNEIQEANPKFTITTIDKFLRLALPTIENKSDKIETQTKREKVVEAATEKIDDMLEFIQELVMSTETGRKVLPKIQEKLNGENDHKQMSTGTSLIRYSQDKIEKRNKF